MELRQFKYFIKAKELMNFTAAAGELHISQSTLSQQIKQLEIELGVPLFERIGKRIKLTEAGNLFYNYAVQSVASAHDGFDLLQDLKKLEIGELKIGSTYGLKQILTKSVKQFLKLYPKISIQIIYGTSEELMDKLDRYELDFVLSFEKFETTKNHKYQSLFESTMTFVSSEKSELKKIKKITLKKLQKFPLVLPSKEFSTRKYLDDVLRKRNIQLNVLLEVNDIPMLIDLVKTGQYHTILGESTIQGFNSIISIPIIQPLLLRKGMVISLKDVYEKKAVKEFYKILNLSNSEP